MFKKQASESYDQQPQLLNANGPAEESGSDLSVHRNKMVNSLVQ